MIHTKQKLQSVVTGFTCDSCGKKVHGEELDHQEALHINTIGGYTSIFGDGMKIECDLCQECVKKLLGDFLRISN